METLNEVFAPLQTKIAFVSANNPGTGGTGGSGGGGIFGAGGSVPQTGDIFGIFFAVIAAIAILGLGYVFAFNRYKEFTKSGTVGKSRNGGSVYGISAKMFIVAMTLLATLGIGGMVWTYSTMNNASASTNTSSMPGVVYAHVDELTGAVTVDDGYIKNDTMRDVYIKSTTLKLDASQGDFSSFKPELTVSALDSTLFKGGVDESWAEADGKIQLVKTLKPGEQTAVHYQINNLSLNNLRSLIGRAPYTFELGYANCSSIVYDKNGADEGSVPPASIKKDGDTSVTVNGAGDLKMYGCTFNGWNTQADGKGKKYNVGDTYSADESVTLYAQWIEDPFVTITYKVDDNFTEYGDVCIGKNSKRSSSVSETIGPRSGFNNTGKAQGATAYVKDGASYKFAGWFVEGEDIIITQPTVVPEKDSNTHVFVEKTYVAKFTYVETFVVDFEVDDPTKGDISDDTKLLTANGSNSVQKRLESGTSYKVENTGNSSSIIFENDAKTTIKATALSGNRFLKWIYIDARGAERDLPSTGILTTDMRRIVAKFSNQNDVTIKYQVESKHGDISVNGRTGTSLEFTVNRNSENAPRATANPILDYVLPNGNGITNYYFVNWTKTVNGVTTEVSTNKDFTPTKDGDVWSDNTVFTAHFAAPYAIYEQDKAKMTFVYTDENYNFNDPNLFIYPVYNTYIPMNNSIKINTPAMYDNNEKIDPRETVVLPAWMDSSGFPLVYPRSIVFDKSFKQYKNLTSTAMWFASDLTDVIPSIYTEDKEKTPVEAVQDLIKRRYMNRLIQSVEGLENVYTENIGSTAFMFYSDRWDSLPLDNLDFSSWNLENCIDMTAMFRGCTTLKTLILPSDTKGHYFGTKATSMSDMFSYCVSLPEFKVKGSFGQNAFYMDNMFSGCTNLETFSFDEQFGDACINASYMFNYCVSLGDVVFKSQFGKYTRAYDSMFEYCINLQDVYNNNEYFGSYTGSFSGERIRGKTLKDMFLACMKLTTVDLSSFVLTTTDRATSMFNMTPALSQITVGNRFNVPFSKLGLSNSSISEELKQGVYEYWYLEGKEINKAMVKDTPLQDNEKGISKAGIYTRIAPKAVVDGETLQFVYDHEVYTDKYYSICPYSGFLSGKLSMVMEMFASSPAKGALSTADLIDDGDINNLVNDVDENKISENDSGRYLQQSAVASSLLYLYGYFLPSWYKFDGPIFEDGFIDLTKPSVEDGMELGYSSEVLVTYMLNRMSSFKCTVDTTNVEFDSTFINMENLLSLSCWFIGDSYGYQPFQTFDVESLEYVPYKNVMSVACMFGGLNKDLADEYKMWSREAIINSNDKYALTEYIAYFIDTYEDSSTETEIVHFGVGNLDETYGSSITELDLSHFSVLVNMIHEPGSLRIPLDLSAMFANCVNLDKVTLPTDYINPINLYDTVFNESNNAYNNILYNYRFISNVGDNERNIAGYNGLFYNCINLTTINNLDKMLDNYNTYLYLLLSAKESVGFKDTPEEKVDSGFRAPVSCYKMFKGCRSLESIDVSLISTEITMEYYGACSFYKMFEDCDMLVNLQTYDPKLSDSEITDSKQESMKMWSIPMEFCGLPDTSEKAVPWNCTWYEDTSQKYIGNLSPKNIPIYINNYDIEILRGEFTRDKSELNKHNYTVDYECGPSKDAGYLSYANNVTPAKYIGDVKYYIDGHNLFVDGWKITPTPNSGYEFVCWELKQGNNTYPVNSDEVKTINSKSTFIAKFKEIGYSAKAVYKVIDGGQYGNTLTFYYDNLSHEGEGEVFDVNPSTYLEANYNEVGSLIYNASLPSWFELYYDGQNSSSGDLTELIAFSDYYFKHKRSSKYKYINLDEFQTEQSILEVLFNSVHLWDYYRDTYWQKNSDGFYDVQYSASWKTRWTIDPQSVIFTESFNKFDNLNSIAAWFMADSNNYQPVYNIYSQDASGKILGGADMFMNLPSDKINNVAYAFGGLAAPFDYFKNQGIIPLSYYLNHGKVSFRSMLYGSGQEYASDYESYGQSIEKLDFTKFNISNLTSMDFMFANAVGLQKIVFPDIPNSTKNVKSMTGTFYNCENLLGDAKDCIVNLDEFDTSNVESMSFMFYSCSGLTRLDLSNFNTEKVTAYFRINVDSGKKEEAAYKQGINGQSLDGSNVSAGQSSVFPSLKPVMDILISNRSVNPMQISQGMFYDCVRLSYLKINSEYDSDWKERQNYSRLKNWTLNLGLCSLPNHIDNSEGESEKEIKEGLWETLQTGDIGLNPEEMPYSIELYENVYSWDVPINPVYTGWIHLKEGTIKTKQVEFEVADLEGKTPGYFSDYQTHTTYDFIQTAQIKVDTKDNNILWADNRRYVPVAYSGYKFAYWTFGCDVGQYKAGDTVPSNFLKVFTAADYDENVKFIANFVDANMYARAVFLADGSGKGTMEFMYNNLSESAIKAKYPSGQVKAIYNVKPNSSEYNLPEWYINRGESWVAGDDHPVPKFQSVIEQNAPNGIDVVFNDDFKDCREITSMSCWFMPAVSNVGQNDAIYCGFSDNPYSSSASDTGTFSIDFANVNMSSIVNVSYMFGGFETATAYSGTTLKSISLQNFDKDKQLKNLDALFANCITLEDINFNNYDSSNIISMSKTFYNCPNLVYKWKEGESSSYLTNILNQLNTQKVTDMSYMFAQYPSEYALATQPVIVSGVDGAKENTYPIVVNFPSAGSKFTTKNVEKMDGMFSNFYNAKSIEISGDSFVNGNNNTKILSTSYMFANNPYMQSVKCTSKNMGFDSSLDTSYMFYDDKRLGYLGSGTTGSVSYLATSDVIQFAGDGKSMDITSSENMSHMFDGCESLGEFNVKRKIATWTEIKDEYSETKYVPSHIITNTSYMFNNCRNLSAVDLSNYYIYTDDLYNDLYEKIYYIYGYSPTYFTSSYKNMFTIDDNLTNTKINKIKFGDVKTYSNEKDWHNDTLQWNTKITAYDLGISLYDENGNYAAWGNIDNGYTGPSDCFPLSVDRWYGYDPNPWWQITYSPFGTYLRQSYVVLPTYNSNGASNCGYNSESFSTHLNKVIVGFGNGIAMEFFYEEITNPDNNYLSLRFITKPEEKRFVYDNINRTTEIYMYPNYTPKSYVVGYLFDVQKDIDLNKYENFLKLGYKGSMEDFFKMSGGNHFNVYMCMYYDETIQTKFRDSYSAKGNEPNDNEFESLNNDRDKLQGSAEALKEYKAEIQKAPDQSVDADASKDTKVNEKDADNSIKAELSEEIIANDFAVPLEAPLSAEQVAEAGAEVAAATFGIIASPALWAIGTIIFAIFF